MGSPYGLSPFPNAIMWNWATIFILGFGNLAALDFQARCMASKTERVATLGCLIAGCITFICGISFAYLGAITRVYYGPDSPRASFVAGVPPCRAACAACLTVWRVLRATRAQLARRRARGGWRIAACAVSKVACRAGCGTVCTRVIRAFYGSRPLAGLRFEARMQDRPV
jgi:hypothetical protein